VTYEILWSDEALSAASTYLEDDRHGVMSVFDATDALATDPTPASSFPWGGGLRRLRVGRYRIIYEVHDITVTIEVVGLGRSA
jgi:mRNA interferase RelE/StbE